MVGLAKKDEPSNKVKICTPVYHINTTFKGSNFHPQGIKGANQHPVHLDP